MNLLTVLAPGPLATVQDLGRRGYAHMGVPPSGALDEAALRRANRLVGNAERAAGIEVTFGGLRFTLDGSALVAVTGAFAPISVGGRERGPGAFRLEAAEELRLGLPAIGVRSYVAIAGGLVPPSVLGSRSTDLLCGLGPAPLRKGDRIPLGEPCGRGDSTEQEPQVAQPSPDSPILLHRGPRADWFAEESLQRLVQEPFEVSAQSNRIAARLRGTPLQRVRREELASEGLVTGAMQVPADGQPLIFLADHPTTGGYPVAAIVDPAELGRIAQARPGSALRFRFA